MDPQTAGDRQMRTATVMTAFIGRRREIEEARRRLDSGRLVTVTGPGGVGKTRLALEVARLCSAELRHGARFVDLSELREQRRIAAAVASGLDVPDQSHRAAIERLAEHLRDKQMLVVLDNCEHVLDAAAELTGHLLGIAPHLRVLVTSREPLGISGESVESLEPMAVPSPSDPGQMEAVQDYDAVRLLVDRARSTVADFAVTAQNAQQVVALCARLDGIPLAIELAAARLRSLSLGQILDRLDHRFELLTRGDRSAAPRQKTLRALIDWSSDLCSDRERILWRRVTVFPGRFDLEAAEEVCGFGDLERSEILDLLDRLVAQSLLQTDRTGPRVRFLQLMTVREYGQELLSGQDEAQELRRRHRDCYLARAELMIREWSGPHQGEHLTRTREDHHNHMAALDWSLETPGERACADRLASALRYHWVAGGHLSDGRAWLERILADEDAVSPERAAALWAAGWLCLLQGDHDSGGAYLERAGAAAERLGDPLVIAEVQQWSALHRLFLGDLEAAIALYSQAERTEAAAGETSLRLTALFQLGLTQVLSGDPAAAGVSSRKVLELSEPRGERWNRAYGLWIGAFSQWCLGEHESARCLAEEALRIQRAFYDGVCTAHCIELLSWISASTGDHRRALELHDVADALWRGLGTTLRAFGPHLSRLSADSAESARRELGGTTAPRPPGRDRRLSQSTAIDLALGEQRRSSAQPERSATWTASSAALPARSGSVPEVSEAIPLTPKEQEVAALVAGGMTNRAIAETLVVSRRTIDGHMEHILAKLGFSSRVQVAAWVERRRARAG